MLINYWMTAVRGFFSPILPSCQPFPSFLRELFFPLVSTIYISQSTVGGFHAAIMYVCCLGPLTVGIILILLIWIAQKYQLQLFDFQNLWLPIHPVFISFSTRFIVFWPEIEAPCNLIKSKLSISPITGI